MTKNQLSVSENEENEYDYFSPQPLATTLSYTNHVHSRKFKNLLLLNDCLPLTLRVCFYKSYFGCW